jgi:signal transduction histidine kinase
MHLGFRMDALEELLQKNRRGILLSSLFMMTIGILAVIFLHRNQQAYLRQLREMERRVYQAERLSALGRLAGGMAHEIRNPLNAISMAAQRLQMEIPGKLPRMIQEEIGSLNLLLENFLSLARNRLVFVERDLIEILEQVLELTKEEAEAQSIQITPTWKEKTIPILMDAFKMKQAILNLIKNAMEAIPEKGFIRLTAERLGENHVAVTVSDTGMGMNSEEILHIFDIDYTTKEKGVGLGLPIAREIVLGHGGEIQVSSEPGKGATFRILLPLGSGNRSFIDTPKDRRLES